jgi:hypothetical protein
VTNLGRLPRRADDRSSAVRPQGRSWLRWLSDLLRELFPEPAQGSSALGKWAAANRLPAVAAQVVAVGVAAIVLLQRIPGTSAWSGIYAEDLSVFLVDALQHPWHNLFVPNAGYIVLVPQALGLVATWLPLHAAAAFFAIAGALIASLCGLFIFHASAGHISSPGLRALLAVAVILLPVASIEIADSGLNTPWYLMMALFWAMLWRPRTRTGMAIAALLAYLTLTSNVLAAVLAPLLLLRVIALPRWREHAVTIGFALGCLTQLPYVLSNADGQHSRVAHPGSLAASAKFYEHRVVQPSLGWHLSWVLQDNLGIGKATLLVGALLAVFFGWALITGSARVRLFVLAALTTGFVFSMVATTVTWWVVTADTPADQKGSRYTDLPILLIQTAAIVVIDFRLRGSRARGSRARDPGPRVSARSIAAVTALVAVLAAGWISDFRDAGNRSNVLVWAQDSASWLRACQRDPTGIITVRTAPGDSPTTWVPCARVHG